ISPGSGERVSRVISWPDCKMASTRIYHTLMENESSEWNIIMSITAGAYGNPMRRILSFLPAALPAAMVIIGSVFGQQVPAPTSPRVPASERSPRTVQATQTPIEDLLPADTI